MDNLHKLLHSIHHLFDKLVVTNVLSYLPLDDIDTLPDEYIKYSHPSIKYRHACAMLAVNRGRCKYNLKNKTLCVTSDCGLIMSEVIWDLTNLEILKLNLETAKNISPKITQLTNLQHLDLSCNNIKEIKPEIWQLTQLKKLILSENKIEQISFQIEQLTNLRVLKLNDNEIEYIPPEIGHLTKLKTLNLNYNNVSYIPLEIIQIVRAHV